MNYINKNNNEMEGVEISDKLRNYYRKGFGVRKRKWRWYILFLAVGEILTNAYIIYMFIRNMHGNPRKHRLSHHDFRKSI